MLFIIPAIFLAAALGTLGFIFIPKFRQISALDVSKLQVARQTKSKDSLIEQRLRRLLRDKFQTGSFKVFTLFSRIAKASIQAIRNLTRSLERLEKEYNQEILKVSHRQKTLPEKMATISELLASAKSLIQNKDYSRAEEKLLNIITQESKNLPAYELLGKLYLEQDQLAEARETFEYLAKLVPNDIEVLKKLSFIYEEAKEWFKLKSVAEQIILLDNSQADVFFDLGLACLNLDKAQEALIGFKRAVEIESGNPRYLDYLLRMCIILKDSSMAEDIFKQLKKANPENKKLDEFKKSISELRKK